MTMMMNKKTEQPWASIGVPLNADLLNMRRAADEGSWDFYWARDIDARCLLVLRGAQSAMPTSRLPHLKGVEILVQCAASDGKAGLVVRLLDQTLRDIFLELCLDVIASTAEAVSESDAIGRAVARTWRWHHLLRGGQGLLSPNEQLGLIGELLIFEQSVLPILGAPGAVEAWRGPLGAPQDFVRGGLSVEAKARGRSDAPDVRINSEQQLDCSPLAQLFLIVTEFDHSIPEEQPGASVSDVARRVRAKVIASDERAVERFDALLEAAGLTWEDDYSAWTWLETAQSVFHVQGEFPRVIPANLPAGVANVRYDLSLPACAEFLVPRASLETALRGVAHV